MRRLRRLLVPIHVVALASCLDAQAWQTTLPRRARGSYLENSEARAVAVAPGKIVAGGTFYTPASSGFLGGAFFVAALSPDTGDVVWQYDGGRGEVAALAVDAAGDVIAAGRTLGSDVLDVRLTVAKLEGATGDELWRHDEPAAWATTVDVDEAGDVLVGGHTDGDGAVVVRLAGATGSPLWTHPVDPLRSGTAVAVRRISGDVASLAVLEQAASPYSPQAMVVQRLAGQDGNERWRRDLTRAIRVDHLSYQWGSLATGPGERIVAVVAERTLPRSDSVLTLAGADGSVLWSYDQLATSAAAAFALLPSGDVLVPERRGTLVRLAAATGEVRWRHAFGCGDGDTVDGVTVDAGGDVLAAITTKDCARRWPDVLSGLLGYTAVAKLSAADGAETWRRLYDGTRPGPFGIGAVAAAPTGDAIVAGASYGLPALRPDFSLPSAFSVVSFGAADGSLRECMDGFVDPGEACDDGNGGTAESSDCCSSSCTLTGPDGTPCSDYDACTTGDACVAGACVATGSLRCEPCGRCEPTAGCQPSPSFECRTPTAAGKAVVSLADRRRARDDAITWRWKSGAATAKADFGDPLGATGYALCMYHGTAPIFMGTIPSNAECPRKTCWRATARGYVYQARSGSPDGIARVTLEAGDAGRARVTVRGGGRKLALPTLPLEVPVRIELRKLDGSEPCWTAQHDRVTTSRTDRFVATNDE